MVQKVSVTITDDITGEEGAETQTFSHNGNLAEIDLAPKMQKELTRALAPFFEHARRATPETRRSHTAARGGGRTPRNRDRSADIRAWAKKKGYEVSDRGRIPAQIEREYTDEANRTGQL